MLMNLVQVPQCMRQFNLENEQNVFVELWHAILTGSDAWRQHASALDAWSFGIVLLELGVGYLYSWVAPIGKIAFQPGRLDAAVPLSREALPANDDWL